MIRVLALLHIVLVTTGAMDSSWAMAKSLAMSHTPITNEEALYQPAGPDAPAPDLAQYDPADQSALAHAHHAEKPTRSIWSASTRAWTVLPSKFKSLSGLKACHGAVRAAPKPTEIRPKPPPAFRAERHCILHGNEALKQPTRAQQRCASLT